MINSNNSSEYQIHLLMDQHSYDIVENLKEILDAPSSSEVVRRALQAYRFFEPDYQPQMYICSELKIGNTVQKSLHIRLPKQTKILLDQHKTENGGTYSDIISKALSVFAELVYQREEDLKLRDKSAGSLDAFPIGRAHLALAL